MIGLEAGNMSFKKIGFPLFFILIGAAFIIPSIPGQGNNVTIAIGLGFLALGIYLARRQPKKGSGSE